ncbi:MAG: DUF3795 domain-containing protein [Promethearchaeota archaeon]
MNRLIAFCGINCSECPAYLATQKGNFDEIKMIAKEWSNESMSFKPEEIYCDGCNSTGRIFSWCSECSIRSCCQEKGFQNCAYCKDYVCDNLKMTFERTPSAKEILDKIKKNI